MSSPTNVVLGTFFLWWGWIGFNCGSQFHISGPDWAVVGRIAVVTMLGAMGGSFAAVLLNLCAHLLGKQEHLLDVGQFTAGLLGGLVSITAACNIITPWEGLLVGFIGGGISIAMIEAVNLLEVDDPVGAVGVHWGGGFWAMIATGLFAQHEVGNTNGSGVFHQGNGELLGWNVLAGVVVTLWSGGLTCALFLAMKYTIGIRVSEEEELKGSDTVEHDAQADYSLEDYLSVFRLNDHRLSLTSEASLLLDEKRLSLTNEAVRKLSEKRVSLTNEAARLLHERRISLTNEASKLLHDKLSKGDK